MTDLIIRLNINGLSYGGNDLTRNRGCFDFKDKNVSVMGPQSLRGVLNFADLYYNIILYALETCQAPLFLIHEDLTDSGIV